MPVWYAVSKDDLRVARKMKKGERIYVDPKLKEGDWYKVHGNVPPPPEQTMRTERGMKGRRGR